MPLMRFTSYLGHAPRGIHSLPNELLDIIFQCLDTPTQAICAIICKTWNAVALDSLWYSVTSHKQLLSLLAPISSENEFERLPLPADWKRFDFYAHRVRLLEYDCGPKLSQTVFDVVARTRTKLNILPKLTTLKWNRDLAIVDIFMHDCIHTFVVDIPLVYSEEDSLAPFAQNVVARMPKLKTIDFRSNLPVRYIENHICDIIQGIQSLTKVVFPQFYTTTRIIEVLSRQPHIGVVEFQYDLSSQGCGDSDDVLSFEPTLEKNAFPSLWDFSVTTRFVDFIRLMNSPFAPTTNLTLLCVSSPIFESPSTVKAVLKVLADTCQLLTTLNIACHVSFQPQGHTFLRSEQIDFSTLKSLSDFPNLTTLELLHRYPLDLDQGNIHALAKSWPNLEVAILNCEPGITDEAHCSLTLAALAPFAQYCPRLRSLGLYVSASGTDLQMTYTSINDIKKPFQSLETLSVGLSVIAPNTGHDVAAGLSLLIPAGCSLEVGISWSLADEDILHLRMLQGRFDAWKAVKDALPSFIKVRTEERERSRVLEEAMLDLQMRNTLLTDQLKMIPRAQNDCVVL